MLQVYQDFGSALPDEAESWRRSKRGPDEPQLSSKGVPLSSSGAATTKRNRSAFSNVTNANAVGTRSTSSRSSHAMSRATTLVDNPQEVHIDLTVNDEQEGQPGLIAVPRWKGSDFRERMTLSPAASVTLAEVGKILDDEMESEGQSTLDCLFEEDKKHANNPQHCIEYVDEIIEHLLKTESKHLPSPTYMETVQNDINQNMRGILIDWLVEVAEEYKLSSENLYLSTNYVDRFLSTTPVLRGRLQLVGVACMLIASKYEEIFAPQVDDFVYITDNTYTSDEVLSMESSILNALRFHLTAVTPHCFLRRLTSLLSMDDQHRHLCEYLAEITLQEFPFLKFRPSHIAFSATVLAWHTLNRTNLPDLLTRVRQVWGISLDEIQLCIRAMHMTHSRIFDKTRTLQASFDKYSHTRFSRVSLLTPLVNPPALTGL